MFKSLYANIKALGPIAVSMIVGGLLALALYHVAADGWLLHVAADDIRASQELQAAQARIQAAQQKAQDAKVRPGPGGPPASAPAGPASAPPSPSAK